MRRAILTLVATFIIIFTGLFFIHPGKAELKPTCPPGQDRCCCKKPKSADKELILENFSRQFISVMPL